MIMIVESFQNKLGLILQYNNNLSQLKDTIHFGFDFNPLINNGISTNSLQAIEKKMQKHKNKNVEFDKIMKQI